MYNKHFIPTLLITTSNCSEDYYDEMGYTKILDNYVDNFSKFVGPTNLLICGNTVQVNDYEETFQVHLDQAKQMGKKLIKE